MVPLMELSHWIHDLIVRFKLTIWIIQTIAMYITAAILPKLKITEFKGAFLIIVSLALVNTHLWDVALFFKIPNEISFEILALICCNGLIFWILVKLLPGIEIQGFFTAIVAASMFTLLTLGLDVSRSYIDWMGLFDFLFGLVRSARDLFLGNADVS